jgi:hypothetical protein
MNSYYLTKRSKYIYFVVSLLLLIAMIGPFVYFFSKNLCFQVYLLGIGLFSIYNLIRTTLNEHIGVSEKGIEYHSPGMIVEANWEDFEQISHYWYHGIRSECLLIDNSQTRIKKWSFPARYPPTTMLESLRQKTIIPLSCFSNNWRDSELGGQIKQYAPHLFK